MFSSLLILMLCIYLFAFIGCVFVKNKYVRNTACVIALLGIIVYSIDLVAYLNGGVKIEEYVTIFQPDEDNSIGYFAVNGKYWGIGGNFQTHKLITVTNPKNTEITVIQAEPWSKEKLCTIYYLPLSKFIMKIEIPTH